MKGSQKSSWMSSLVRSRGVAAAIASPVGTTDQEGMIEETSKDSESAYELPRASLARDMNSSLWSTRSSSANNTAKISRVRRRRKGKGEKKEAEIDSPLEPGIAKGRVEWTG